MRALYHRVVSINRPSGYEPDALPLRHDDGLSLDGFDPPPLVRIRPVRSHYATMTRFIFAPKAQATVSKRKRLFPSAHICRSLHCVHYRINFTKLTNGVN